VTRLIPPRAPGVASRQVGDEFVVICEAAGTAHNLAAESAAVWAVAGTGERPPGLSDAQISRAVAELTDLGLLDAPGVSRRTMLRRSGVVAAGVAGVSIASIALPPAAYAKSNKNITLTPGTGTVGSPVSVSGSGFTATGSGVSIQFDGVTVTTTPASPVTSGTGAFSNVQFTVPAAVAGPHTVAVVVGAESVTATYTVTSAVTISPTTFTKKTGSGSPIVNTTTATGTGFAANQPITVTSLNTGFTATGTATSSASGSFTMTVTLTQSNNGGQNDTIRFSDGTNTVDVPVTYV
jgi:hypothetical protein